MAVIRHASTPMVDLTALVKKDTCWQKMASLVKVCVYASQLLKLVSDTGTGWDNNYYNWGTYCSYSIILWGYLEPRKLEGRGAVCEGGKGVREGD